METDSTVRSAISGLYQDASNTKEAYICARIEGQIGYYEAKSAHSKKLYYFLSAFAIVANAAVPVISVFLQTADGSSWIKMVIALLSSLALISTSLLALFNAKELWSKYRSGASNLASLLHQYYAHAGVFDGSNEEEAFRLLAKLAESYLGEENKAWGELLHSDRSNSAVQ